MAIDEALTSSISSKDFSPIIRFYRWDNPTLSIGYSQNFNRVVNEDLCHKTSTSIVRRLTGGRAVLHDLELTYSVILPANHPLTPKDIISSYKLIAEGLLKGYENIGIPATLSETFTTTKDSFKTAACFDSPSIYEIVYKNKKICGSAQVRTKEAVLQHGSILINRDVDRLFNILNFSTPESKCFAKDRYIKKSSSIEEILNIDINIDDLIINFTKGFESVFKQSGIFSQLSDKEVELSNLLILKYKNADFLKNGKKSYM